MKRFGGLLLLLTVVMTGWSAGTTFAAGMAEVRQEAERGGYRLLTSEELRDLVNRDQSGLLLVDTRQDWEYAAGHIQGAVNFPMEPTWLARLTRRGELEQFLGPDRDRSIVFY